MIILVSGLSLFLISFAIHLILWRIKQPTNSVRVIIVIFICIPILCLTFFNLGYFDNLLNSYSIVLSLAEILHIHLFYITLSAIYLLVYLGLPEDSPSLFIIISLSNSLKNGLSIDELNELITDDIFLLPRVNFLIDEKLISLSNGKYILNPKGKTFLKTFLIIQKIYNLQNKAG
jgi:hypothetical protein